jgi:hypothetical protein
MEGGGSGTVSTSFWVSVAGEASGEDLGLTDTSGEGESFGEGSGLIGVPGEDNNSHPAISATRKKTPINVQISFFIFKPPYY